MGAAGQHGEATQAAQGVRHGAIRAGGKRVHRDVIGNGVGETSTSEITVGGATEVNAVGLAKPRGTESHDAPHATGKLRATGELEADKTAERVPHDVDLFVASHGFYQLVHALGDRCRAVRAVGRRHKRDATASKRKAQPPEHSRRGIGAVQQHHHRAVRHLRGGGEAPAWKVGEDVAESDHGMRSGLRSAPSARECHIMNASLHTSKPCDQQLYR